MYTLTIIPNFSFSMNRREAGDYFLVLPQGKTNLVILKMWCSSFHWAIQDATCYLTDFLDDAFGRDNWEILFNPQSVNNPTIDLREYFNIRSNYHLPPWEEDKEDIYQHHLNYCSFF